MANYHWNKNSVDNFDSMIYQSYWNSCDDSCVFTKYGLNSDVDTGTREDVWNVGGTLEFPPSEEYLDIVSDSAQDGVGGTGAREVFLVGLDGNYDIIFDAVVMNGITTVKTNKKFLILDFARVDTSGSNQFNVGEVTFTTDTSGLIQGQLNAGEGRTSNTHLVIPRNYRANMNNVMISLYPESGNIQKTATVSLEFSCPGFGAVRQDTIGLVSTGGATVRYQYWNPIEMYEFEEMKFTVDARDNNCAVSVSYTTAWTKGF